MPLVVLINSCHLVVLDYLFKHFTVDVGALQGLAILASAENVA